jgi:hypothetical protein
VALQALYQMSPCFSSCSRFSRPLFLRFRNNFIRDGVGSKSHASLKRSFESAFEIETHCDIRPECLRIGGYHSLF